ncbi:MAG: pseudouridine synthase [Motiliproteus sp.]|nr:pseudouridine synthase [Motiliproteus sp.]
MERINGIDILFQDESIVVVDKPHDLLSVPGKGPDNKDCVVSRLQQRFPTIRIVHRLDCATSGVMVLALDADSHRHLSRQFQERQTHKVYVAKVYGQPSDNQGQVELPLRCDWENRPKQMVDWEQGKHALTHWYVLSRDSESARIKLTPITGRSHQLRVHMLAMGHPILGDRFYASGKALNCSPRLLLHAQLLELSHPITEKRQAFQSICPF